MPAVPVARQDYDAVLDVLGLLLEPHTLRRYDLTSFSPSVRATNPRYQDFSTHQFWPIESFHRGRGQLDFDDPFSFYDSAGTWTHIPREVILAALQNSTIITGGGSIGGPPLVFALVTTSATLYCFTGGASREGWSWDNVNGDWDDENATLAADPTDAAEFRGFLHVAQGEANNMRRKNLTTNAWAADNVPAVLLLNFNDQVLYRSDNINEIFYTTTASPASADWTGPLYVGDTNTSIRGMAVGAGRLWVGKDDGLYYIQDNRVYQHIDFRWARDSNNFTRMTWWNGALYFPILHGLYRLIGDTLQAIGPDVGADGSFKSLASGKRGRIVDLVPAGPFLFAVIDGSTSDTSQIIVFNDAGWGQLVEGAASGTRIQRAFLTGRLATSGQFNNPRLWYGYGSDAYNIILPFGTNDPTEYTSQTYRASGGTVDTSRFDAGLANVWKEWVAVHLYSETLTADETVQCAFELDDIGTFQNLVDSAGSAYAFTVSPYQRIDFPENNISKNIQLRFTLNRGGTNTNTPKIVTAVVEYVVRADVKYGWQVVARSGRHMSNPWTEQQVGASREATDALEILQHLYRLREYRTRVRWDDGNVEPGITNLVLNPVFRIDSNSDGLADNWNEVANPVTSLSLIRKLFGTRGQQVVTGATGSEGVETDTITTVNNSRYTASAYVYLDAGDTVTLELRDQAGGTVIASESHTTPLDRWVRLEATGRATSTSTRVRIVRLTGNATAATTFIVSGVQLELTDDDRDANFDRKATSLCTGDEPRCRWSGRPHLSTSVRDGFYTVQVSTIQGIERKRPGIMDWLRGRGPEYRVIFTVVESS